jgi:hypothetical protein
MSKTKTATVRTIRKSNKISISEKDLLAVESRVNKAVHMLEELTFKSQNGELSPIQLERSILKIQDSLNAALDPIGDQISDAYMRSSSR